MHDLAIVGAYTKDTIVRPSGVTHVDGGGYAYAAMAARLTGQSVLAVTKLAEEDEGVVEPLRQAGVEVITLPSRRSTLMRLEYPGENPDERILSVAAVVDPFVPEDVAAIEARAFLITASIRGEAPVALLEAVKAKGALLAIDIQGFVRIVGPEGGLVYDSAGWRERAAVLGLVDILKTDAVEAEALTGEADIHLAARRLAAEGPAEIVLTHKDGVLVHADGRDFEAPFTPDVMRGRSGRGDTCIGSYVSRRLQAEAEEATRWAGAVTTLKLEREGPVQATADTVRSRLVSA